MLLNELKAAPSYSAKKMTVVFEDEGGGSISGV
jgi:hypothetical protein